MIDPTKLNIGDVVIFGGTVEKTVGAIDWSSPSSQVLISFGAVDSWHYQDDPLWQIAEIKPRLLDPHIQAKAIMAAEDWFARRDRALLLYDKPTPRNMMLEAYENGYCQGFSDAREDKNGG